MHYYRLSGEAANLAAQQAAEHEAAKKKMLDYVAASGWGDQCLTHEDIYHRVELRGVAKPTTSIPQHFRPSKHKAGFMEPKKSTKRGREIAKEWADLTESRETDAKLCAHLGIARMQFVGMSVSSPCSFSFPGVGSWIMSEKRIAHAEAVEIPKGELQDIFEAENKRREQAKEAIKFSAGSPSGKASGS